MKRRIISLILALATLLFLCACTGKNGNSTFSIRFIDVGQGDAALVECDGHYMLIDGGDTTAGDTVYNVLEENGIQRLDILAVSHLHIDHYGGLIKALTYVSSIGITLSNADYSDTKAFMDFEHQLHINGSKITIPTPGKTHKSGKTREYELGSATVEVIDSIAEENNDSLVLLIEYGSTRFLFTGDIENSAQKRISEIYQNESDEPFKIDLIKMPHHGSYTENLYRFLRTFMPDYAIISCGDENMYGHPDEKTLKLLNSKTWSSKVYRTDRDGDIIVKSNGKELSVETSK